MKLNELTPPSGAVKRRKRVGRGVGSGRGKTCTRGHKGQNSRSGGGVPSWFEGGQMPLQRRIPKRGFHNKFKKSYQIVNLEKLSDFEEGASVKAEVLAEKGIISSSSRPVKVLGRGKIGVSLQLEVDRISKSAAKAVIDAGGSVKLASGGELPAPDSEERE